MKKIKDDIYFIRETPILKAKRSGIGKLNPPMADYAIPRCRG
jgi:hypothetical protein